MTTLENDRDVSASVLVKFGLSADDRVPYRYPRHYQRQEMQGSQSRLVIGIPSSPIDLVTALTERLTPPFWLLYVLVVPCSAEFAAGRYQCPMQLSLEELQAFLSEFREFLEGDGRHHLWIASPASETIVYDRHEIIYAYGPVNDFAEVLVARGFEEHEVNVPGPHAHFYHREYEPMFQRLMQRWAWIHSPLRAQDEA